MYALSPQTGLKFGRGSIRIQSKLLSPITLPPFSTTVLKGHTQLNGHGMRLNLIAESSEINQLPPSVQHIPTYCNLEPGSNQITVGLRNVLAKQITIPSRAVVCQVQLANMVLKIQTQKDKIPQHRGRVILGYWINWIGGIRKMVRGSVASC